jgi:hypothetical protein
MSLDKLQQLKQGLNQDNVNNYNNADNSSTQSNFENTTPKKKKLKFLLPIILSTLILLTLAIAGFTLYSNFLSPKPFVADKDLFKGKITKLTQDFDLIIKPEQVEGVDCSSDPKIQEEKSISSCQKPLTFDYYKAGTFNKGQYKDYDRIIALEPTTGLMSIFATKDYNKFVFNGNPDLKNQTPEDENYIYKVLKQDKISNIDYLPQEFNQFLEINDNFVLSSTVIDKDVFCPLSTTNDNIEEYNCNLDADKSKLKAVGKTDSGYDIYVGDSDRYYVYDQSGLLYTSFINHKTPLQKSLLLDEEGKKISPLVINNTPNESIIKQYPSFEYRNKLCSFYLSLDSNIIETKEVILPNYNYNQENCNLINESGSNYSSQIQVVDVKSSDIEKIGNIKDSKTEVYKYKNSDNPKITELMENLEMEGIEVSVNKEELIKKVPFLIIQDPFGRYLQIQGSSDVLTTSEKTKK